MKKRYLQSTVKWKSAITLMFFSCFFIFRITAADCQCLESEKQIPPPPDEFDMESQCGGTIDWIDVELYTGTLGPTANFVMNHERPVGQIQWNNDLNTIYTNPGNVNNQRWCSGTLIADNLFLTAGHCFDEQTNDGVGWDSPLDNATGNEISPAEAATNMHVNFNYQLNGRGVPRAETEFDIVALSEYRLGGLDYAIVQLTGNPGRTFTTTNMRDTIPDTNDQLTIIQHPNGGRKVIEAGNYDGIETGRDLRGYMRYTNLDTEGGSSGSGILDDNGNLIGVHTNGGCTLTGGANHGVLIDDINDVSPIINGILFPPHTQFMEFQQTAGPQFGKTYTNSPVLAYVLYSSGNYYATGVTITVREGDDGDYCDPMWDGYNYIQYESIDNQALTNDGFMIWFLTSHSGIWEDISDVRESCPL